MSLRVRVSEDWRVHAEDVIELALPARTVWGQMRDLRRFLTLDPLHAEVVVEGGAAVGAGAGLTIRHRFLGLGVDRVGRVLRWNDGRGYSVSDLSRRGVGVGFPHVCSYDLEEVGAERCVLRVSATGRWTARWMPVWMVRLWMWWVLVQTRARIVRELDAVAWWRGGVGGGRGWREVSRTGG